jgi:tetratricopeptide (TPR) repeat protein
VDKERVRRVLNLRLLLITLAFGGVLCAIGYFWYWYRYRQVAVVIEQRAAKSEHEGQWRDAAGYLKRYLRFNPDDLNARVRLVEAVEKSPRSLQQQHYLLGLLHQTLGLQPERHDLRLKLANLLLESNDFAGAETEAQKALRSQVALEQRAARKNISLSLLARARANGLISFDKAAAALSSALAENPSDVTLAARTAALYREHPESAGTNDAPSKADQMMDRLVQLQPDNAEALIARYDYRHRYNPTKNAKQDLEKVLAHDADNVEALLRLATEDMQSGGDKNLSAAEETLKKVVKFNPADPRGQFGLAQLYIGKGDRQRALEILQRGKPHLTTASLEVDSLLAGILIESNRLDEAEKALNQFDDEFRQKLPELTTVGRTRLENFARMLRARLDIGRNDLAQASRELSAIIASVGDADIAAGATERLEAHALLAVVMFKMGRPDLAASHWRAVADRSPNYQEAAVKAAVAYLALGRPSEAIGLLEPYVQSPTASAEAWTVLLEAHLQKQMSANERDWTAFASVLEQAKRKFPNRAEILIAEVAYWRALGTDKSKQMALQQLSQLEKAEADKSTILGRIAVCYQQLGASAEANRVLEQFDKTEPNRIRRALLHSAILVEQGQGEKAAQLLTSTAAAVNPSDRRELQLARTKLQVATRQLDAAQQSAATLIEEQPNDKSSTMLGIEIALMRQDFTTAERLENALKALSSSDDFDWRFCRARRLVAQFAKLTPQTRSELDSLLDGLRSDRPDWCPLIALTGEYADLSGNRGQAIDAYRQAIDLGDRRPETTERLVAALYTEGRYNEANTYLSRLRADQPANDRIESLAIELAVKQNRLAAALDLAKQAVARGPNDPTHYLWLANLQSLNNQQQDAEKTFREAIRRFPDDPRVWNSLFAYFIRAKQPDKARHALEQWSQKANGPEASKQFILAQGYELLGDTAAAQKYYRATIAADPKNIQGRLRLAKLLLSSDVVAARGEFEEVLKIDSKNSEARRSVASLLAVSGNDEDWNHAVQLLQSSTRANAADDAVADDRLHAILLSRRGRTRAERLQNCEAARRILSLRISQSDEAGIDLDRMLLARIFEQEAAMGDDRASVLAARDALRPLVDRDNPPPAYLTTYIELLLRHLERSQTTAEAPADERERRAVLISDASQRISELEASLHDASAADRFAPVAFRVRLFVTQNQPDKGLKLLNKVAAEQLKGATTDADRAKLLLQLGSLATKAGYRQEAENWYRQLLAIAPNSYVLLANSLSEQKKYKEAVDLCLRVAPKRPAGEVATILTQLLSTAGDDKDLASRAQPAIAAALDADRNNVELLMSIAVRQVTMGNYDEAIKLFRRVLELQPNNTLALNNLATLLSERPDQLAEARACVERAIAIVGRSPALLDTLGTIEIRAGRPEQAIADLEEAVAGTASDPRYYFHLAVAYQRSQHGPKAQEALANADKYGLERAILTAGDRELLSSLKQKQVTGAQQQ